jgi:glycosyltransferase involved in cell wall biosynthesis
MEFTVRPKQVAFAARWDSEKQPEFFMDVVRAASAIDPEINFVVLTGLPKLKSNSQYLVDQANAIQRVKNLKFKVLTGLSKNEYYKHLANSRVLFNCALQDWCSNTVSEADAFGCATLFPAYRSFPETFSNNADHMYIPWSVDDAAQKLVRIINSKLEQQDIGKISAYQDKTIERTISVLSRTDDAEFELGRNGLDYRKYVTKSNF